jgi:hypothetical protein
VVAFLLHGIERGPQLGHPLFGHSAPPARFRQGVVRIVVCVSLPSGAKTGTGANTRYNSAGSICHSPWLPLTAGILPTLMALRINDLARPVAAAACCILMRMVVLPVVYWSIARPGADTLFPGL